MIRYIFYFPEDPADVVEQVTATFRVPVDLACIQNLRDGQAYGPVRVVNLFRFH